MNIILFGAGTIGRLIARQLVAKGTPPVQFADNDTQKWGVSVEGIGVSSPQWCKETFPGARWVATVHRIPARPEILAQLADMAVEQVSLYEFLPARCDLPPAASTIENLLSDEESVSEWYDQLAFRRNPATHAQRPPRDISNVYFEDFFTHRDDEHFVDCGAADGDTIRDFQTRWDNYGEITAFEPDPSNHAKLLASVHRIVHIHNAAIGDRETTLNFSATGDQTAHIDASGSISVKCVRLDDQEFETPPTLIKMDIESAELEGLWGARGIIKKHSPVLAICAYHLGSHLWEIPLLIHALNPTYRLYFRRYLEAAWELIWYAVPPERVK